MEHSPEKHQSLAQSKNCEITLANSQELGAFLNRDEIFSEALYDGDLQGSDHLNISIERLDSADPISAYVSLRPSEPHRDAHEQLERIAKTLAENGHEKGRSSDTKTGSRAEFTVCDHTVTIHIEAGEIVLTSHKDADATEKESPEAKSLENLRTACIGASLLYESLYPDRQCRIELNIPTTRIEQSHTSSQPEQQYRTETEFFSDSGMSAVGGLAEAKNHFGETIAALTRLDLAQRYHLRPSHTLMYGPTGTGKSLLAQALAEELSAQLTIVQPAGIIDSAIGKTGANIRAAIESVRGKSVRQVLFFDHIEALASKQAHAEYKAATEELAMLIDQLTYAHSNIVIVAATTSMPDTLNGTLIRSGRLEPLAILPPDELERREIWAIGITAGSAPNTTQGISIESSSDAMPLLYADDINVRKLAQLSERMTGADCMTALDRARRKAFLRAYRGTPNSCVTQADIEEEILALRRHY